MQRRRPSAGPSPSARGITLLEVVLSSSLALLLIGAVYAALDQSWRLMYVGRFEIERNQMARAILRQMELDIRAVMFAAQAASTDTGSSDSSTSGSSTGTGSSSTSGSGTSGSTNGSSTSTTVVSTTSETEETWTGSFGIRGSATELWLDLSHVARQLEFPPDFSSTRVSDLQTVTYYLSSSLEVSSADGSAAGSPVATQDLDGVALCRSQGDRSILQSLLSSNAAGLSVATTSSGAALPGPVKVLSPEIQRVEFRYFDGLSWYTDWDSVALGALPRAVEVTLYFEPPPKLTGFLLSPAIASGSEVYRMVVPVPVSNPMPPEDSL